MRTFLQFSYLYSKTWFHARSVFPLFDCEFVVGSREDDSGKFDSIFLSNCQKIIILIIIQKNKSSTTVLIYTDYKFLIFQLK